GRHYDARGRLCRDQGRNRVRILPWRRAQADRATASMTAASSSLLRAVSGRETTRWMTLRYVLALGLVAALSMAAWLALRQAITAQETAAAIINYSGQRRYLSQRAALACLQRTVSTD